MFKISVNSEPSHQEVCQKSEQVFLCLSSQQSMILVSVKLWEGNKIHYQKMLWFIRKSLSLFIRSIVKINLEEYLKMCSISRELVYKKSNFKTRMSYIVNKDHCLKKKTHQIWSCHNTSKKCEILWNPPNIFTAK